MNLTLQARDLLPVLIDGEDPRWCCRTRIETYAAILEVDEDDTPVRWRGLVPAVTLPELQKQASRERWSFIPLFATVTLPDVPYGTTVDSGTVVFDGRFAAGFLHATQPEPQPSKRRKPR